MQQIKRRRPLYVVTDNDELLLKEDEAAYIRGYRINFNINGKLATGTGGSSQGGNFGIGTPIQATKAAAPDLILPAGTNKCIGSYECQELNEIYWFNWNSNNLHGIYRLSGNTLKADIVYIGACLNFSLNPKYTLDNRVSVHVVYDVDHDGNRKVKSIYLKFLDGLNWHRWIDVLNSISTEGFNYEKYPYYTPVAPHKNSCDLINWAVTPPFKCPSVSIIPYQKSDIGKNNSSRNKSIQFANQFIYTDGRPTTLSPYSLPVVVNSGGCSDLATNTPRCVSITMDAGNPHVEQIRILFRNCGGDFFEYDTIDKYTKCGTGSIYERTIALPGYNAVDNTFTYTYCGDKECKIFSPDDSTNRVQSDMPIVSYALTPVGDAVLMCNNLYGYDNLGCDVLENISINVAPANPESASCTLSTVIIRAYTTINGAPIIRLEEGDDGMVVMPDNMAAKVQGVPYKRSPNGEITNKKGLIGYLAGTPYAVIGEQYRVDSNGSMEKVGVLNYYDKNVQTAVLNTFVAGGYYVQRYEFVVPAGTYLFRVASHKAQVTDIDYQETSTFIYGHANIVGFPIGQYLFQVKNKDFTHKELFIEACAGSVDTFVDQDKLVLDFANPRLFDIDREKWFSGYINDTSEVDNKGIELLEYVVTEGFPENIVSGRYTDHNGFYFTSVNRGGANNAEVVFWGEYNCQMTTRGNPFLTTTSGKRPRGKKGFEQNISIKDAKGSYQLCNEVRIKGRITDSDGNGISGVSVVITRGNSTITNGEGYYTLKVHRGSVRALLSDKVLINSLGGCALVSSDCKCLPTFTYLHPKECTCPGERIYPLSFNVSAKYINTSNRGLKGGGRYGISTVLDDGAGRMTFANNIGYIDIPTFLETGIFAPPVISWKINEAFTVPSEFKYMSFYRTSNLNYDTYIQWVGDKIQFINARGEDVTTSDEAVRVKVTIQSLLDFNRENNFATTVDYQFVAGDILRIYDDGNNNLFRVDEDNAFLDYLILGTNFNESVEGTSISSTTSETVDGVTTSQTTTKVEASSDGKSFIIAYDKRLDKLKDHCGFWIEIIRPHKCENKELYYEICGVYPIQDGKLMNDVKGGVLETWDTYYQNRFIMPTDCAAKTISHPFESDSVTDYWGRGCTSNGRVTTVDRQASQKWFGNDTIKSDDFVNEGRVNGLGTFRSKNRKDFKGQEFGPIISVHAERSIVAFICQNDWFLTDYNMNFIRATAQGLILANLENNLSDPHQKVGSNYGCEFEDNATIIYDDGIVMWADRKNANVVAMDYRNATDIAIINNKGYFVEKFRYVTQHNNALPPEMYLENLIEIVASKDPKYGEYTITFRPRRGLSEEYYNYYNNERETRTEMQESFTYNLAEKRWMRFEHHTPEHYGALRHSITGLEMISFKNGYPYFHNSNDVRKFNTVYGIECDQVISIIENFDPSKVKIYQSSAIESNGVGYFVDLIYTNEPNSYSYIPLGMWEKKEGVYYATILRDMNSYDIDDKPFRSKLYDGKRVFGNFVFMRFVRDTNKRTAYSELNNIWTRIIGSELSEK
jgi:hypothetical protein